MHTDNHDHEPEIIDTSKGYESSDVQVTGIVVFVVALSIFTVVVAVLCYGIGKAINSHMAHEDGPKSRWARPVDVTPLGTMAANPALQNKLAESVNQMPAPRLQNDDGLADVAEMHAREDVLLNHYTWADKATGKVRIPIDLAVRLIAQRGLPVAVEQAASKPMTGDEQPSIHTPLTSGFVRTAYEQAEAEKQKTGTE